MTKNSTKRFSKYSRIRLRFIQAEWLDYGADALRLQFPGSDPNVISVGGTQLDAEGNQLAWDLSGGGFSRFFQLPYYQQAVYQGTPRLQQTSRFTSSGVPGRMVPDMAFGAQNAPGTGIAVNMTTLGLGWQDVGGTSACAPIAAALFADSIELRGHRPINYIHEDIYGAVLASLNQYFALFRDITAGNNGWYSAAPGYDTVTGWGIPYFGHLAKYLARQP